VIDQDLCICWVLDTWCVLRTGPVNWLTCWSGSCNRGSKSLADTTHPRSSIGQPGCLVWSHMQPLVANQAGRQASLTRTRSTMCGLAQLVTDSVGLQVPSWQKRHLSGQSSGLGPLCAETSSMSPSDLYVQFEAHKLYSKVAAAVPANKTPTVPVCSRQLDLPALP